MDTLTHNRQIVTVIIAVYNGAETIESTINSVLKQSCKFINILICDDCSSDNSINKIVDINNSQITLLKNETNIGLTKTRKKLPPQIPFLQHISCPRQTLETLFPII